jgi:hypothetical protein
MQHDHARWYSRQAPMPTVLPVRVLLIGFARDNLLSNLDSLLQKLLLIGAVNQVNPEPAF